jgi:hypothetical protein
MIRRRAICAGLLLVVLLVSACSGSSKHGDRTPASAAGTTSGKPASAGTTSTPASAPTSTTGTTPGSTTSPTGVSSRRLPPVGVGTEAPLTPRQIFVTVTKIKAQMLGARGPGETAGPGVVVTLEVRNASDAPFGLNGLAVNAHYGNGIPAVPNRVPGEPLVGTLAPGQHKSGLYEFHIARGEERTVVLDIEHASAPNVVIVDNVH